MPSHSIEGTRVTVKSRAVWPQNPCPFHTPAANLPPAPGFLLSLHGLPFLPISPHKAPQTPSFALQPTNAFPAPGERRSSKRSLCYLSLRCLLTTHLPGRSLAQRGWVSPSRLVRGNHPHPALPESPKFTVLTSGASAETSSFATLKGFLLQLETNI